MNLLRRFAYAIPLLVLATGCSTSAPLPLEESLPEAILEAGPTPLPERSPHPPGELFAYTAHNGDTLPALAAHFNTNVEEIMAANPDLPETVTTLPPGYPLQIPAYYVPLTGSPFHILPDSEFVNGPTAVGFDIRAELLRHPGFLADMADFAYQRQREAWDVINVIAQNYSIHPRLLITLMEYQTQALTKPFPDGNQDVFPMGVEDLRYDGLFWQLIWAAERLNDGYYGWRDGTLTAFELTDGLLVRPDPWLNAPSAALQYFFAALYSGEDFERAVGTEGFFRTYTELWGDPFLLSEDFIPGSLQQPDMTLPFEPDTVWEFTAGPHYSWGTSLPWGALDFAPPSEQSGCVYSGEWIAAPAEGVIVRSGESTVVLDLDGDGDERTGWVVFMFHVAEEGRIAAGVTVEQGDSIGHPSCEGGRATGTHVHIARRYNGEWIPATGPLAFNLSGFVAEGGGEVYEGSLIRGSLVVPATTYASAESRISYEGPGGEDVETLP
ncbi:MAG: LysM peptidoglycan-binding domain-containing protein [Anaerolineales bacterium]|nr:LysM peptidoglycan-binding domain-containing protein [Anaerolineales bacterium]